MTTRRKLLGAAGAVALMAMGATSAMAQEVTLKLHQFLRLRPMCPS